MNKKLVSLKLHPKLLRDSRRAAREAYMTWTAWVEQAILARLCQREVGSVHREQEGKLNHKEGELQ